MKQHLVNQFWRLLPGGLAAATIAILLGLGDFQPLEQIAYRRLFQARGAMAWDERLVVVTIDDASLKQLGRFPWARRYYTQLLNRLSDADASVVVFDLIWSEPSPDDAQLSQAMMRHGQVVLAQAWDTSGLPLMPMPDLAAAAIATGHALKREDTDGLVRQVELQIQGQPSLGVAAIQAYSLVQTTVPLPNLQQPFWVNWVSPASQLHRYSFADVIQGKVPAQALRHKIVVVGVTATGLDPLVTPFDRNPSTGSVYLHATVIHNLLQQNPLRPLQGTGLWLALLLSAPGLSWLMSFWSTRQQCVAIAGLGCGWGLLAVSLFHANYWLPITPPIALFFTTAAIVVLSDRLREDHLLRRQIAYLWQHYHQDLVTRAVKPEQPLVLAQPQKIWHTLLQPKGMVSQVAQLAALADQLGRSQSTQIAIANTLSIGVLAADLDGDIWFCNPAAAQVLQVNVGNHLNHQLVPNWLSPAQWQTSLDSLKAGNSIKYSNLHCGDRWFNITLQPLAYGTVPIDPNRSSPLDGFLLLLEDITSYKQTEAELQQAKEIAQLEAERSAGANQAKSIFLANMSHELRTPLNVILGFTQVMTHDNALRPEHQTHLKIINRSGQHLLGLINDVLEMSKIEAGRVQLNSTSFDIYCLLDDLEAMLRARADAKHLTFTVEYSPDLPQYVTTDEGKLRQILLNVVGNAIKFTEAGGVTLRVWLDREAGDGWKGTDEALQAENLAPINLHPPYPAPPTSHTLSRILVFEVEDTGLGIAPGDLKHLFQPFEQTNIGKQAKEGTGLGLAISQKFVHLMGGDITVQSTIAQGSIFTFHIRVGVATASDIVAPIVKGGILAIAPNQPTYRILIVEDQWENSEFLVKLLAPVGFDVREASNGEDGIAVWEDWHPHLILMDMRMPVMDGAEATRQIRSREAHPTPHTPHPRTKILALTASVFEETKAAADTIGCDDFLRKPIHESTLLLKLAEHLGVRYVYDNTSKAEENHDRFPARSVTDDLTSYLTQLPISWVEQLHQNAIKGSDRSIFKLIETLPTTHAPLEQALTEWVDNFQFDKILQLTQTLLH